MIKNLKQIVSVLALVAFATPAFSAVTIFNRSLANQAGQNFDSVLETWDYLMFPGLYSNIKDATLSFGFTNEAGNGLTAQNSFFGGGHFNVGLPIYLIAGLRNASSYASNADSTSTAQPNGATTTNPSTKTTTLDSTSRVALGSSFGTLGVQLFGEFNSIGTDSDYTNPNATLAQLKTGAIKRRTTTSTDKYGINVGSKSGDMVWNVGIAMNPSPGSTATFVSADGTIKESFTNSSLVTSNGFVGLGDATVTNMTRINNNNGGAAVNDLHERGGLIVSSIGWMPMPLLTAKDILGWRVNYNPSTMLGSKNYVVKYSNTTTNDDWTAELDAKASGLGKLTLNPYLTIPKPINGDNGMFFLSFDLNFFMDSSTVETTPKLSGKLANTAFTATQIADGFDTISAAGDKCANVSVKYCEVIKAETSKTTIALGVPLVVELNVSKSFIWIIGTVPKITYTKYKKTTTTSDLNDPKASATTVAVDSANDGTIATTVTFATGARYKIADNFDLSLLATGSATALTTYQFSAAANYIFK